MKWVHPDGKSIVRLLLIVAVAILAFIFVLMGCTEKENTTIPETILGDWKIENVQSESVCYGTIYPVFNQEWCHIHDNIRFNKEYVFPEFHYDLRRNSDDEVPTYCSSSTYSYMYNLTEDTVSWTDWRDNEITFSYTVLNDVLTLTQTVDDCTIVITYNRTGPPTGF